MSDDPCGWAWLDGVRPATGNDDERLELARAAARAFSGADGERLIAHLRTATLERSLGPDAGGRVLRHLEGQRQLVLYLSALIAFGRSGIHPTTTKP